MFKRALLVTATILAVSAGLAAQEYKVVVPQVSPTAIDVYTKTITAIAESEGKTVSVQVLPFARCVYLMEMKQADIQSAITQIPDTAKWAELKYDYSTSPFLDIVFVLYTNKAKPITAAELKAGNAKGYKIETETAHVPHFPFASPSTNIDASLNKLAAGTIDGYIFSQGSTDAALKRLALKNIHRENYTTLNGVFLIQKGGRGGPIDKMITSGLAKIKANGKYQEIVGAYAETASKFIEWQPQ
jgi:polar amino acid transport system substrate-binding protein